MIPSTNTAWDKAAAAFSDEDIEIMLAIAREIARCRDPNDAIPIFQEIVADNQTIAYAALLSFMTGLAEMRSRLHLERN